MRHYSTIINLAVSYCKHLETSLNEKPIGTNIIEVQSLLNKEPQDVLVEWLSELQEWQGAMSIQGISRYNTTDGIKSVIRALKSEIRNKKIYDILENN
jgi:hypothetical protein